MKLNFKTYLALGVVLGSFFASDAVYADGLCWEGVKGEIIWHSGVLEAPPASRLRYCNGTVWKYMTDGTQEASTTIGGFNASSFWRIDASNAHNVRLSAGDGRGLRFWDNDTYKIYMSATGNATWGGRLDSTSDYNIYFRMGGGINRGFVFGAPGTASKEFQIDATGAQYAGGNVKIRDANGGNIYSKNGLINNTHGGGWHMIDNTWLRVFGNKTLYQPSGTLRTDGVLQVGPNGNFLNVLNNSTLTIGGGSTLYADQATRRVGIRTTTPQSALHVNGDVVAQFFMKKSNTPFPGVMGDMNGDGGVSGADIVMCNRARTGVDPGFANAYNFFANGDLNKDGRITHEDCDNITRLAIGVPVDYTYYSLRRFNASANNLTSTFPMRSGRMQAGTIEIATQASLHEGPAVILHRGAAPMDLAFLRRTTDRLQLLVTTGDPVVIRNSMILSNNGNVGLGPNASGAPGYKLEMPNIGSVSYQGRANAWQLYSDARFKIEVERIRDAAHKVRMLDGIYYNSKPTKENPEPPKELGFIAQDVEAFVPEVVSIAPTEVTDMGGNKTIVDDYRSMDYARLTAVLVEAIKEKSEENKILRVKAEEQKAKIQEMIDKAEEINAFLRAYNAKKYKEKASE